MLRAWLPTATGAILVVTGIALGVAGLPSTLAVACGLAGVTLAVVALPERRRKEASDRSAKSWLDLGLAMGLHGPAVAPDGRAFLAAKPLTVPPLSDGRAIYDGQDGFAAGIAFWTPSLLLLETAAAEDLKRFRDLAALEEDLGAVAARAGTVQSVRVLAEPGGLRVRWTGPDSTAHPMRFLVPTVAARAAGKTAFVSEAADGEVAIRWVES